MKNLSGQFRQLLLIICLLFCGSLVVAQNKPGKPSHEFKTFSKISNKASVAFVLPEGFSEVNPENTSYEYGLAIPDQLDIWLKVIPQTEGVTDSAYVEIGHTQAKQLAGETRFYERGMPDNVLSDYNADAGKTYFISLPDSPTTKHYKYALLITLQKNRKGTIMALCLSNDRGPDFFKSINKARNCIKFKPSGS